MTLPGSLSHGTHGDDWVGRKLRDLEAQIRALTTAQSLQNASVSTGTLSIDAGGTFQLTSADGVAVFLANSEGLAVPFLPLGQWVDVSGSTVQTASASWATLQVCDGYRHHPSIAVSVLVVTDAATTGDVQVLTGAGQLIGSHSTAAGTSETVTLGPLVAPVDNAAVYPEPISYQIQARVTSGTGKIGVRGLSCFGLQG